MNLRILSVNIGRARAIGMHQGRTVISGIDKQPVAGEVRVRALGIDGDEQADLTVHGGAGKAVYAYPSEHWPWWQDEKHLACRPASFGENLTTEGAGECDIAIGDRFRWGDCLLEVSQPRAPCYKLAMHTGRVDVPQAMAFSTRCGWYFRVIEEGHAPQRALERVANGANISVHDAFRALLDRHAERELLLRVRDTPLLAEAWRRGIVRKLGEIH